MTQPPDKTEAHHRITDVLRCKWTLAVLSELKRGTSRPSDLRRALTGISQKVLHERLRKLEAFGLLERAAFAEVPPRVEYTLSDRGAELANLAERVDAFAADWARAGDP